MTALPDRSDTTSVRTRIGALVIAIALAVGAATAALTYWHLSVMQPLALGFDFTWPWRAARILLAHGNPYLEIKPTGQFPFDAYFKYPLPAAVVAIPFAWLPARAAAAAFGGVCAALLAIACASDGRARLPVFISAPFVITALSGQWSNLLMAGGLLPALGWVVACKPTVGFAIFCYRPRWSAIVGGVVLLALSFVLVPTWLGDWLHVLRADAALMSPYIAPVTLWGGPLLLLAALRWRTDEGRLLFMLALVPQIMTFYSALPVFLTARSYRENLILAVSSGIGWLWYRMSLGDAQEITRLPMYASYWMLGFVYLPALAMVLLRANEGLVLPAAIERRLASLAARTRPAMDAVRRVVPGR